jgi:outer membrane protein assembly factor BamB
MKQPKILFLVVIALLPLILVSCSSIFGGASVSRGWAGTTFSDGIVYVGTRDGKVVAINSSNQSEEWEYTPPTPTALYATPIVSGDLVYVGTYSGEVHALNATNGEDIWVYPPKGEGYVGAIVGRPVIVGDTILVSSSDGKVYALNTINGKYKWEWEPEPPTEKLWTSPTVVGDTIYVSTFDGYIYSLSAETGVSLNWSFEAKAGFASSPVIYEDAIYVGSFDRHLYAIEIGSNVSMWKFPQEKPAGNWFWASPVVNEGIVYAGCLDGKLYAINATTGKEIWSYMTEDQQGNPSPIISSPVLMGNFLIVTNESGNVYVFDLNAEIEHQGIPVKTISIGAAVRSPFCAQEGLVYIRGEDNQLYVVNIDKGEVSWKFSLTTK